MTPDRSSVSIQLYGRACLQCSRSKCKCVTRAGGQGCERCYRLDRPCLPSNSTRARNTLRNNPIARIAQLEGKVDDLFSSLEAAKALDTSPANAESLSLPVSSSSSPIPADVTAAPSVPAANTSPEQCLAIFRRDMLKYFPVLHISENVKWLREERPFLFLCIMDATSKSTQTKLALGDKIKRTLTRRMFLDNDPGAVNIDLLLGLLTFLAWGHDNLLHGTASRLSRLTQLAMTLVFDLRLNKPPPDDSNMLPYGKHCLNSREPAPSLEERRALLGCFVMSSIVSSYLGQIDPLQWTPYMDECLEIISHSEESPYDKMFAHQVRLQRIAGEAEIIKGKATAPASFYLAALQNKIKTVREDIPPQLQHDRTLLASIYYTELCIFSLMLPTQDSSGFERLENLYGCLNTVKSALDNFFHIPLTDYPGISFPFFTQLARYIVVLYKLSTSRDPAWGSNLVRSTVDILEAMDRLIGNIQHARAAEGDNAVDGPLEKSLKIFTSVKMRCAATLSEIVKGNSTNVTHQTSWENAMPSETLFFHDSSLNDSFTYGIFPGIDSF